MLGALAASSLLAGVLGLTSLWRRPGPSLASRVLPYTDDGWQPSRTSLAVRWGRALLSLAERAGSTTSSVERRLNTLGAGTLRSFRLSQARWALAGAGAGTALSLSLLLRHAPGLLALAGPLVGALVGALAADSLLTRRVTAYSARMTQELPDIAELLALAVSAGQSMRAALEYVSHAATGVLAGELRRTLAAVRAGESLPRALAGLGARCGNSDVERFVEALGTSLERGTPLGEVLRAQAADAREYARRQLLEEGGRKEVRMLLPVVFLIMPITILFTLYPGLMAILHLP